MSRTTSISAFVARHVGHSVEDHELELTELGGGLEASSVMLVTARPCRPGGAPFRFVVKVLSGRGRREAVIYQHLARRDVSLAARTLCIEDDAERSSSLYLEALGRPDAWPWSELEIARAVLEKLAGLHASVRLEASALPPWDYEADLCERGEALCRTLDRVPRTGELQDLRAALPAVRRLVSDIPSWRAHLLERAPLRQTLIHGDVHTANVLFRGEGADARPVLIDWGRARFGSPLEDVSSWLQSLGYWEPRARRKHDTLLKAYLAQLGLELDDELRRAYWLAGASNALAGALHYHVVCALGADDAAKRGAALHAARDWLRILRGTDIRWRRFGGVPSQRDAGVRRTVG